MSVNCTIIGSINGFMLIWCQAVIQTNAGILNKTPCNNTQWRGIILCMCPANERRYIVMLSPIGWAHTQNNPWMEGLSSFILCVGSIFVWVLVIIWSADVVLSWWKAWYWFNAENSISIIISLNICSLILLGIWQYTYMTAKILLIWWFNIQDVFIKNSHLWRYHNVCLEEPS